MTERQGLVLRKSGRRDPRATDFGTYMLVSKTSYEVVAGADFRSDGPHWTLDDVERYLNGGV